MGCIVLNVTGMQMDVSFWKVSAKILLNTSAEGGGEEFVYDYKCYTSFEFCSSFQGIESTRSTLKLCNLLLVEPSQIPFNHTEAKAWLLLP